MNSDGSGRVNLTNHSSQDVAPNWHPEGMRIVFQSDRDGAAGDAKRQIYAMNSDGSGATNLSNNLTRFDIQPLYSADGELIVFTSGPSLTGPFDIWTMRANGSAPKNLTNNPSSDDLQAQWSPCL